MNAQNTIFQGVLIVFDETAATRIDAFISEILHVDKDQSLNDSLR